MEKNMSKSNDSSKLGRAPQVRELRDDELQEVSGGRDVRKGGAIIVYDYEGSALRGGTSAQQAKVTA
jgi:bacteriocin-like protein